MNKYEDMLDMKRPVSKKHLQPYPGIEKLWLKK